MVLNLLFSSANSTDVPSLYKNQRIDSYSLHRHHQLGENRRIDDELSAFKPSDEFDNGHKANDDEANFSDGDYNQEKDGTEMYQISNDNSGLIDSKRIKQLEIRKRTLSKMDCQEPEIDYLESLYSEFQTYYNKYEEPVRKRIKSKMHTSEPNASVISRHMENTHCNIDNHNRTELRERSVCPWKIEHIIRADRFPFKIRSVKCTCDKCIAFKKELSSQSFKCEPVFRTFPVLVRDKCRADGYYGWNTSIEEIAISCTCASIISTYPTK
jgi:hypothetical protein